MARAPDKPDRKPPAVPASEDGEAIARMIEQSEALEAFDDPAKLRIGKVISRAALTPGKRRPRKPR
jgi:hypothetical protein